MNVPMKLFFWSKLQYTDIQGDILRPTHGTKTAVCKPY